MQIVNIKSLYTWRVWHAGRVKVLVITAVNTKPYYIKFTATFTQLKDDDKIYCSGSDTS